MQQDNIDRQLKKGSAEVLILSLLEARDRHGYDLAKRIEQLSDGALRFQVASLYPVLYRMEARGWIEGTWVEESGERRRRFYRLTPTGKTELESQRKSWKRFVDALHAVAFEGDG